MLSLLYAAHQEGKKNVGVDIEAAGAGVKDITQDGIYDLYLAKFWGLKFATAAACTVLKVDQVCETTMLQVLVISFLFIYCTFGSLYGIINILA